MVVIVPLAIPNCGCSTCTTGARQLVVQEAFDSTWCLVGSYMWAFTPSTTVRSSCVAGAEMMTFFTLPRRWALALVASVNLPVASTTTWTSSADQSISAGSLVAKSLIDWAPMLMWSSWARTSWAQGPNVESYFNRCARVFASVRSFTATNSIAGLLMPARNTFLPMRPQPLIPTLIAIRDISLQTW